MSKKITLFVSLLCTCAVLGLRGVPVYGQTVEDTIVSNFKVIEQIPLEKLYLHLDKPFYGAGDKIWFKGYLVNAMTHKNDALSNFIITELINRSDSIIVRKKIRRDSLGFHNAFTLPATLAPGEYQIRGYTQWMMNGDPDFFYSRNLSIGNAIDNTILSSIEYQQEEDTHYTVKVRFYNNNLKEPFVDTSVRYQYFENGKQKDKGRRKTDENGLFTISLSNLKSPADRWLYVEFDDPTYLYDKTFYMPSFSQEFDVTFFPEGGSLLAVPHQNVAFKAQGADGYSKDVEGVVISQQGDTLTWFKSEHDGMGAFLMNPLPGVSYYALVTSSDGLTKRFDLPPVENRGWALSMVYYRREIRYEIQKTDSTVWDSPLYLAAHTRGQLKLLQPITPNRAHGKMHDSIFTEGITHFILADGKGNILSERLIFVPDWNKPQWSVTTDKPTYDRREKVSLTISATSSDGAPLQGDFSISVTDKSSVKPDSVAEDIQSNLLLTSDLKGYIHNPGYYFMSKDTRTLRALDFVMLTHGWRRHKLTKLTETPEFNVSYFIERGQTVSGRIKGPFGGKVKKGPIYVLSPKENIICTTETDENGEFLVNTSFRDSTTFVVQARTKRGFAGVDILMDEITYPGVTRKNPFHTTGTTALMDDYLFNTRDQYYMEGGMRVYNLKEVVIKAKKKPEKESIYAGGMNTYTMGSDKLEEMGAGLNALDVIRRLPGVTIKDGNEVHIRGNDNAALVVINDMFYEEDTDILLSIMVGDIASVSLLRGTDTMILGPRASAGAVVITLKDINDIPSRPPSGIITFSPLGYSQSVEFYHPTYETPQEREDTSHTDLRSTIYWNPSFQLDGQGSVTLEYYTPDSTAEEYVVIEGVDSQGKACHVTHTINKK